MHDLSNFEHWWRKALINLWTLKYNSVDPTKETLQPVLPHMPRGCIVCDGGDKSKWHEIKTYVGINVKIVPTGSSGPD